MRTLVALVALVTATACQEAAPMSSTDYDPHLAAQKITNLSTSVPAQFGQSLQVRLNPGSSTAATVAKDLARWRGKTTTDIQPIRIYLGPWQPVPTIDVSNVPAVPSYMEPTPWQEPRPAQYDAFAAGGLYARISFGGGGVQHQAYVDWSPRGSVLQVVAQYVQVDGVGTIAPGGVVPESQLPRLSAHIGPEPGGGDSVQPATYTYPGVDFNPDPAPALVMFQVPPFARSFRPLIDQWAAASQPIYAYVVQIGGLDMKWLLKPDDFNSFNRDDLPLPNDSRQVLIYALNDQLQPLHTINVGCMFMLDL